MLRVGHVIEPVQNVGLTSSLSLAHFCYLSFSVSLSLSLSLALARCVCVCVSLSLSLSRHFFFQKPFYNRCLFFVPCLATDFPDFLTEALQSSRP